MSQWKPMLLGATAAGLETLAGATLFLPDTPTAVYCAIAYHIGAVASCTAAARYRSAHRGAEQSAIVITALFVPIFGPALAWMFPNQRNPDSPVNAHAYFERFESLAEQAELRTGCLPEEGAFEASQAHPLSLAEVLRHGSIAHKRNALAKLAELGRPRHLRMLRKALVTENSELRLCAFIELNRIAKRHEDRIASLRGQLAGELAVDEAQTLAVELARAHLELASSGALDKEMGQYHSQQAVRAIDAPWRERPCDLSTALVRARVLSYVGNHTAALRGLDGLPRKLRTDPDVRRARAEVAFRLRDFDTVRREAKSLDAANEACPDWMKLLQPVFIEDTESVSGEGEGQ